MGFLVGYLTSETILNIKIFNFKKNEKNFKRGFFN